MDDKDKQIEELKSQLQNATDSRLNLHDQLDELKKELELYKKLVKAQSDVINFWMVFPGFDSPAETKSKAARAWETTAALQQRSLK